jgi:putative endonuclease
MESYWVYLAHCADDTYYCGSTTDLDRRLAEHNGKENRGARYTRCRRPVRIVAAWQAGTRSEAQGLEALLKKLPHRRKEQLVKGKDLADILPRKK